MMHISFIVLKGNVVDNYSSTKKNWRSKYINWEDLKNVVSNSKIQYSCYEWRNGVKTAFNFDRSKQTHITLDVDNGLTIAEFQRMFSKYTYCISTTKSNMKEKKGVVCERFRVSIEAINISKDDDVYFRSLELIAPFNDEQTLTKTASFLGDDNSIVIYNKGKALDMFKANTFAEEQIRLEESEKITIDPDLVTSRGGYSLQRIKEDLDFETIVSVLESCGYEVIGNKLKLREDERTMSTVINYRSLNINDFGGQFGGDIFALLMEYQNMTFPQAIQFVSNHV